VLLYFAFPDNKLLQETHQEMR